MIIEKHAEVFWSKILLLEKNKNKTSISVNPIAIKENDNWLKYLLWICLVSSNFEKMIIEKHTEVFFVKDFTIREKQEQNFYFGQSNYN